MKYYSTHRDTDAYEITPELPLNSKIFRIISTTIIKYIAQLLTWIEIYFFFTIFTIEIEFVRHIVYF